LHPGTEELRIVFALTVVLGVSTPTLTSTTANSVSYHIDDVTPQPRKPELVPAPALMDLSEIEGIVGKLANLTSGDATAEEAAKGEEPDAASEDATVAVTVPIERVCEALADAAIAQDLPIGFFARLIWQESRFDQWARSPVGAQGVAQFMPPTAAEYGLQNPFDPIESVAASARFLAQLRDQFGNLGLAAAAYNAGGGRIKKWLNGQSTLPQETQNYVSVITGHAAKRWTVQKPLEVRFALPRQAPCDGVEGLSREAASAQHQVRLTELTVDLIEQAEVARRAKIAAERAARKRYIAARAAKARKLAAARAAGA
jgi:hypothetical protein